MTEQEMADLVMDIIGFDTSDEGKRIVEVEAGMYINEVEVEDDSGVRFVISVRRKRED